MFQLKNAILTVTALTLSFAVQTANLYFYPAETLRSSKAAAHTDAAVNINDKTMDYLFPYIQLESGTQQPDTCEVPANMTYSPAEFAIFKDTYLAETAEAGNSYFNNILFCGDSLTYSMGIDSRYLASYDVLAWGGLGVYDYLDYTDNPSYNQSEELFSPITWMENLKPDVVYIMLGTNGIAIWSNENHIKYYNAMLDRIEKALPNARIVLIGIPPWAESRNTESFNGQKFDNFNMMLLETAYERGYYYLNFAEVTRDDNGNFRTDLCGSDGIHWLDSCKKLFLNYVKTHTLP